MFLKEYSLKVEQWSSKSHVWVRFLLLLLLRLRKFKHNIDFKYKIKIKNLINRNKKNRIFYSNLFNYNSFYFKFERKFKINKKFFKKFFFTKTPLQKISSFNLFRVDKHLGIFLIFNKNIIIFNQNFHEKYINFFLKKLYSSVFTTFNQKNIDFYFYFYINNLTIQKTLTNFFNFSFVKTETFSKLFNTSSFNFNRSRNNYNFKINSGKITKSKLNPYFDREIKVISLFKLNRYFFITFSKLSKNISIFKISKQDWISEYVAKITRDSLNLQTNDYFAYKILNKSLQNNKNKILSLLSTLILKNDLFKEDVLFSTNNNSINFNNILKNNQNFNYISLKSNLLSNAKFLEFNKFNFFSISNFSFISYSSIELLVFFIFNPLFYKFSLLKDETNTESSFKNFATNFNKIYTNIKENFFYTNKNILFLNNIIPVSSFYYVLKKKILKVFSYNKFPTITAMWHYSVFIKFLEFFTSRKVYFKVFGFIQNKLDNQEKAQCLLWAQKVKYFRKVLGPRLFLNESLQILYLALKLKDPFLLSNWMVATMQKISFWKHKTFLRYLKYVLRYFFWVIFKELKIKGIKFQLKGKISVAGNARTRTVFHTVGFTSHTTFNNKILYKLNLVKTFTGVLGFKLWIVF